MFYNCQQAKNRYDARKAKYVRTRNVKVVLGLKKTSWVKVFKDGLFQNLFCRTNHIFARKQNVSCRKHIKILPGSLKKNGFKSSNIFLQSTSLSAKKSKTFNLRKKFFFTIHPKFSKSKHCENTCLVCNVRWLLSV